MSRSTCKNLGILLMASLCCNIGWSQQIDTAIANYNSKVIYEKAYVHFDNSKYAVGQTIWYKAYLMTGIQPSLISKNFYIDWYDDNGKLISSSVTPISYSYSSGHFTIPENIDAKYIHAVAYTKWMRNFDTAYFFQQSFPLLTNNKSTALFNAVEGESSIQFLPESGSFIANKLNTIAFKAVNKKGLPEFISGVVRNSKGDSVATIRTLHDGMGKFQLSPMSNEVYTAIWKDPQGNIHKNTLPKVEDVGINLLLEPGRANRLFHVQRTKNIPDQLKQLTMVGQMNGAILFKANLNLSDKESITSTLPISKMASGILQVTIFDANTQPVCERVLFVKNEDYILNTDITIDTLSTVKRAKNVIEITLNDTSYANLSLSITDAGTSDEPANTIVSQLLLNSNLAGNIYKPAYYFSTNADSVSNHLDLVMLTNGWRKYNWKDILSNTIPKIKFEKENEYQSISGKVLDYNNRKGKKPETINLILVAKDSSNNMLVLPVLEDGAFVSKNAILYDTTKVYYKMNGSTPLTKNNLTIQNDLFRISSNWLYKIPNSIIDTNGTAKIQMQLSQQRKLDSINKYNTLREATVYSRQKARIKELDKKYTFGLFSGEATAAFDMSTLQNASHTIDIFDFLTGKVPGLVVGDRLGGTITEGVIEYRGATPSFYLNEYPLQTSELANLNMNDIAYIKVFSSAFAGGMSASESSTNPSIPEKGKSSSQTVRNVMPSNSVIAIYTKKGGEQNSNYFNSNGLDYKTLVGYVPYKEFYAPNYVEKLQSELVQDLRTTLAWNPWINLDKKNKKSKIVFYNNDMSSSFRLILEGMDSKGRLVHINKLLK